ncbi:transducin beta-like protein 3 [Eriocheir sinensis]|uniref:transducin beta-like protein 3 n=1 Tax=Eriocheir sinensis TaxID=95602 RepID=UPI0021CA6659|nr:transducin beta-like protein 3 [Eriocheir sinensis]
MGSKALLKNNFTVEAKYDAYFTGQRVEVTSDGSAVLCECGDSVGVVSLASGKVTGSIKCEEDQVTSIALAPDDSFVVVALKSTSVQQYKWPSLELVRSFKSYHRGPVVTMAWDSTSTLVVTGGADSSARVWDLVNKYCTHSLKGASGVFGAITFHPDLMKVPQVYGAVANTIHVWTLESGSSSMTATLAGHHSAITALQVTHDTKHMVSCGLDRVIILWDMTTFTSQKVVPVLESLSGIVLQPQGTCFPGAQEDTDHIYALVVGDKGVPSVWEVDSGREVWRAPEPVMSQPDKEGVTLVNHLTYSKTLDSVVMTTYDHSILFAKTSSMKIWKQLAGYNDQILDAVFVGAGESHLVVATNSIQLRIYHCESFSCCLVKGHTALVLALARHPTLPTIFASSSHDNSCLVWRLTEEGGAECLARAVGHTLSVGSVALAQDFMVTGSKDMCIKKWTLGKEVLESSKAEVASSVALSSSHTEKAHEKDINSMCVSVNGKLIATGSQDKTAKVWDSSSLALLGVLRGHRRGIWCVQFSPVDEVLATASADATIKIWTMTDFTNALTLEGHSVSVLRLCWVSEGQQLLSTASDGLLKLWTIKTRQCVQTFDEHQDKTWAMAVSEDEKRVVTGGEDAALVLWRDVTQEEKEKAAEEAARLAAEEQTLLNLIQNKQWTKALGIAVRLGQPGRALKIMKTLLDETPEELPAVMAKMRLDQVAALLEFATSWNTKTKDSREAQSVLNVVLKTYLPEELEALDGWQKTLEGLLPYTERHLRRVSALHQSSGILNYMSSCLTLAPDPSTLKAPPVMEEAELLTLIPAPQPLKRESEEESGDDDDDDDDDDAMKEEEDIDMEVKITLQNSIMKTEESESEEEDETEVIPTVKEGTERNDEVESDEDEGIEEGSKEDSDEERTSGVPLASQDDLDANFIIEKIEGSSGSEDEEAFSDGGNEIEENPGTKRKGFSVDQLQLESKSKNKRLKGSVEKGKDFHMKKKNRTGIDKFNKNRNQGEKERKKGKTVPTRQNARGRKRKKVT